jgi:formiminoglutamate deiminase
MGQALIAAAHDAGIRITLLDTCYLRAGFGRDELNPVQVRFSDGDVESWAGRVAALTGANGPTSRVGAAIHSVRAVPEPGIKAVADWADAAGAPVHVHVSEQRGENTDCLAATGMTPTALLAAGGALGRRATAVHATHLTAADIDTLGSSGTAVCFGPTTERDLADGIGPARLLVDAGAVLCLGSDSHAQIDLFEEARAVELDERLATGRRGNLHPSRLLAAAAAGGAASLGWDAGLLEPGRLADFTTIDLEHSVRLAGAGSDPANAVAQAVFASAAGDVTHVIVGGRLIVEQGRHLMLPDVPGALAAAIGGLAP